LLLPGLLLLQYTRQKEVTRDLQAALQKAQAQTQLVLESKVGAAQDMRKVQHMGVEGLQDMGWGRV
jgi:hypothetical protein